MTEYIYVFGSIEMTRVKIGWSVDPGARLQRLQPLSPFLLELWWQQEGDRDLELALHHKFAQYRKHCEWFDFGPIGENEVVARVSAAVARLDPTLAEARRQRQQRTDDRATARLEEFRRTLEAAASYLE